MIDRRRRSTPWGVRLAATFAIAAGLTFLASVAFVAGHFIAKLW